MSFGRPPGFSVFTVSPPDRGSFPLDHEGECAAAMKAYMQCMKSSKGDNGQCRHLSKQYLQCRMDRGLMEKDNMLNLGFQGNEDVAAGTTIVEPQSSNQTKFEPQSSDQRRI